MDRADIAPPSADYRPEQRVRRRSEYRRIQSRGRRVHTPHFILLLHPSVAALGGSQAEGCRRLGITATRKIANAVGRNRIKRCVREAFRRHDEWFPLGFDVVFIAKRGAEKLGYSDVRDEVAAVRGAMRAAADRFEERESAKR